MFRIHSKSNGIAPVSHSAAATMSVMSGSPTQAAPNLNSMHGTKRLASCREELERSWQGGATSPSRQYLHSISNDGSGSGLEEDSLENSSRAKRRRTAEPNYNNDDSMMECSFVGSTRISPHNRPQDMNQQPRATPRPQVKAGWYEGGVDAHGNRHGKGKTKHDDGSEFDGTYVHDVMEGPNGRYKFATTQHLVPNPAQNGSSLHRQVEKSFEGTFENDMPEGVGMIITKTVDCSPQVLGSTPVDVRFMEVMYDVGMHKKHTEGRAVGEGVRIIYSTTNVDGRSSLGLDCFRLSNGENTHGEHSMRVAKEYATWMLQCMNVGFPAPPSSSV